MLELTELERLQKNVVDARTYYANWGWRLGGKAWEKAELELSNYLKEQDK